MDFEKFCAEKMYDEQAFINNLEEEDLTERKFVIELLLICIDN